MVEDPGQNDTEYFTETSAETSMKKMNSITFPQNQFRTEIIFKG